MKKNRNIIWKLTSIMLLSSVLVSNIFSFSLVSASSSQTKIIYPLKEVSKLSCRFQDFKDLKSNCKRNLPILHTKDYKKYIKLNWGYNDYTRFYTTLWWASYKYGWDVWFWGHEWTDIATAKWTPVYAIADWKVIVAKRALGWGNVVTIEHFIRWKKVFSNYAHMSKILVKKGQRVSVWTKIWEVWSDWNSTWNHLHFQIDLDTPFHPFYYSRKTCPYSYHDITEKWVCFNELAQNTIDPLLFVETNWKILDSIKQVKKISRSNFWKTVVKSNSTKKVVYKKQKNDDIMWVFNRTVYIWYSKDDIKKVQKIFKTLWYYKWAIDWDYKKLEKNVIEYQINRKIISSKNDLWAGRFGPKTRAQAKKDYLAIIKWLWQVKSSFKSKNVVLNNKVDLPQFQKISRTHILTRAEIEKREIDDFLREYNINLNLSNIWGNINKWNSINLKIEIKSKRRKNRFFKWTTPLNLTFETSNNNVRVFPKKLYYFSDWKRNVNITWLKEGTTRLQVKFGSRILKTFNLRILKAWKKIYPKTARIYSSKKIVYWEIKTWIGLMKDSSWKKLINIPYWSTFKLKAENWVVCIKRWNLRNIRTIFRRKCSEKDFKKEINFSYKDTIAWLVIFDYKATSSNPKIEIINNYNNKVLAYKNIYSVLPKDLKRNYVYYQDVKNMLEKNIVSWVNRWYFQANKDLKAKEALSWIENALYKLKDNTIDEDLKNKIDKRLAMIKKERISKYKAISRKEFIELSYKYLVFDDSKWYKLKNYRDIDEKLNKKVAKIFWDNTWKDEFWKSYFRPNVHINKAEAAFVLNNLYKKNKSYFLALR